MHPHHELKKRLSRDDVAKYLNPVERCFVGRHGRVRVYDQQLDIFSRFCFPVFYAIAVSWLYANIPEDAVAHPGSFSSEACITEEAVA